jgi:hypothetical protein
MSDINKISYITPSNPLSTFQCRTKDWSAWYFGDKSIASMNDLNSCFLESALRLVKAHSCTREDISAMIDYVYSQPADKVNDCIGGVMVTLACLCNASDISMHDNGEVELSKLRDDGEFLHGTNKNKKRLISVTCSTLVQSVFWPSDCI